MDQVIIYSIATGSLYFLSLMALATPRKVNVKANVWLGIFLFALACTLLDRVLFDIQLYEKFGDVKGLLEVTRFGMAPALYFSVLYFTLPDRKFKTSDYLHFIPFFLFFLFVVTIFLRINDSSVFGWYYNLSDATRRGVSILVFSSIKIQMVAYWILSYRQLVRHQKNIKLFASSLEPISLSWLQYFLIGLVVLILLSLNEILLIVPAIVPFTHLGYLLLIYYIGYYLLRQQEIYPYQKKDVSDLKDIIEEDQQPQKQERMANDVLVLYKQSVLSVMENDKVYLDPELGLPQLASRLKMSTHDLSFVLNEGFKENFFQFINRYRVEEAKILLRSEKYKHLSILGIAFESGFSSKTTFNTTFKKSTGQSPSQFMEGSEPPLQCNVG